MRANVLVFGLQPALPAYRVPVLRELAAREGLAITLHYGVQPNLSNAPADGFDATAVKNTPS